MSEFKLPDVGEGLTEAEIVTWKVEVGQVIEVNDIVVEIETAKSLVELPSPYAGEVTALLVPEGETVPVGTPIIRIGADEPAAGGAPGASAGTPAPEMEIDLSNPAASGGGEGESLVGRNKADRGPTRRARRGAGAVAANRQAQAAFEPGASPVVEEETAEEPVPATTVVEQGGAPARALAKPPVRKLAKDHGVDLTTLTGSGPQGSITRDDVHAASGGRAATSPSTPWVEQRRAPARSARRDPAPPPSARPASRSRACAR